MNVQISTIIYIFEVKVNHCPRRSYIQTATTCFFTRSSGPEVKCRNKHISVVSSQVNDIPVVLVFVQKHIFFLNYSESLLPTDTLFLSMKVTA
jgi:hypothetical protein